MDEHLARVVDLELRFMKLERDLRELSDVVVAQQRVIDALRLEAQRLRDREPDDDESPGHERPPHY
jgi:uncharacterized coiled-coil protein SlyX